MRTSSLGATTTDDLRTTRRAALSVGWAALASLLCGAGSEKSDADARQASINSDTSPRPPNFPPRAQRMILLFQHGGPSQIDLFDPKPVLERYAGQKMPGGVEAFFDTQDSNVCTPSPFRFQRHGSSGLEFSELLPRMAECADDVCMIRSLQTVVNDHEGALRHFQTGKPRVGRPTLGAWISYALGSPNRRLPPYVVLADPKYNQVDGIRNWSSGFLPALYQGTQLRCDGPALFDLARPTDVTEEMQRNQLDFLGALNREHHARYAHLNELDARIANYALAADIGDEVSAAMDISRETQQTERLYGLESEATGTYGRRCLMARRLLERGVRFVAVFNDEIMGDPWDTHTDHNNRMKRVCDNVDQPSAALIADLKRLGLLGDSIILWVGEFGRLPVSQGKDGRDHNRHAFTALVAGGGFRPGVVFGQTDEFGYKVVENPVSIGDLHATLLRQFGLDHERLGVWRQGREESLTDAAITGAKPVDALVS